jgi:tRNA (guanine-N7-)-methyltransferase
LQGDDKTPPGESSAAVWSDEPRRRALYGRSRGKTLRQYHARLVREFLPEIEIAADSLAAPAMLFGFEPREIWLEIGFGGGEHLLNHAAAMPEIGFIGCEPFLNGVAKLLAGIDELRLSNVRVRSGDAGALLAAMPSGFLTLVFCLYPDPWPKRRQNKRRLISAALIAELARVLRPGGQLRFASDIDDYCGWTLQRFLGSKEFSWQATRSGDWRAPWPAWRATRYEQKARREGRTSTYLTFQRV